MFPIVTTILIGFSIFNLKGYLPKVLSSQTENVDVDESEQDDDLIASQSGSRKREVQEKIRQRKEEQEKKKIELDSKKIGIKREIQQRREEFKNELRQIKDENKKRKLENINEELTKINERWVKHWKNSLERLQALLAKIEERSDKLNASGKNTSDLEVAIAEAETALDTAKNTVDLQSAKTYSIEITDETTVKEDAKSAISTLKADMKEVHEIIQKARQAIVTALKAAAEAGNSN